MTQSDRQQGSSERRSGDDIIDERLMDDQQEGQQSVVDAASDAFVRDQESPDHPTRIKRSLSDEEDPAHSRGSGRHGAGEGEYNRNR